MVKWSRERTALINHNYEFHFRESGKIEALKTMHSKKLETMIVEKVYTNL